MLLIFSLQTLYTYPENFRAYKALIAAQYSGCNVKVDPGFVFGETNKTDAFLKKFPLGKVIWKQILKLYTCFFISFHVSVSMAESCMCIAYGTGMAILILHNSFYHFADKGMCT